MIPLILETDSSRVVSMMIHDHGSVPQVRGVSVDQHNLSHHGQDETKIAQLKKVETEIVRAFGDLLTDLQGRGDASGSLLDRTAVLFGSNLGNANAHTPVDLPIPPCRGRFLAREAHRARGRAQRAALQRVRDDAAEHGGGGRFVRAEHRHAHLVVTVRRGQMTAGRGLPA